MCHDAVSAGTKFAGREKGMVASTMTRYDRIRFMVPVAEAAVADWRNRRICLPSITTAIAIEGTDWGRAVAYREYKCLFPLRHDGIHSHENVLAAVRSHNEYLATWRGEGQQTPNWEELGREYYILAAQYLQSATYPYSPDKGFETRIVELVERYGLTVYDAM